MGESTCPDTHIGSLLAFTKQTNISLEFSCSCQTFDDDSLFDDDAEDDDDDDDFDLNIGGHITALFEDTVAVTDDDDDDDGDDSILGAFVVEKEVAMVHQVGEEEDFDWVDEEEDDGFVFVGDQD